MFVGDCGEQALIAKNDLSGYFNLQGHTAAQLKVGITQYTWLASQPVGAYECDRLLVLFAGARLTCSLGTCTC